MSAHAKLSASGSARWLACPGSVAAEQDLPESTSPAASEGIAAHALAEMCLVECINASDCVGKPVPGHENHEVTPEMADAVQQYVDHVRNLGGDQSYEVTVDYSDWVPGGFGTCDALAVVGDTIYVTDLKYGKGIKVDAYQNSQGMLYALGALNEYELLSELKHVVITIVQPRLDHIDEWKLSVDDLRKWGEWASYRAELCLNDDAERVPGEKQCQWCKAKARCPEQLAHAERVLLVDFDDVSDQKPVSTLNDEQLRAALEGKKLIVSWLDAVEKHVTERLQSGEGFDGFKLVAGRALRQWADENAAAEVLSERLGDNAFTKKLLSPSQAEKVLGKAKAKDIAPLIVKPEGKPTLAPESDKREAINITANDFD